jgi:DNA-binding XRE family transcriptional regulator
MHDQTTCSVCNGTKHQSGFVTGADGRHHISAEAPCPQCKGTGVLTAEQLEWIQVGRHFRIERIAQRKSITAAAERLGISATQLIEAELGRIAPSILTSRMPAVESTT